MMENWMDFNAFPKMGRLFRECWVTEKIDGTNAQVLVFPADEIGPEGINASEPRAVFQTKYGLDFFGGYGVAAGSRTRWITPEDDNFGFAAWVKSHAEELVKLGPGRHFGEWWGRGIQRNYGIDERRFSLFNVSRWCLHGQEPQLIPSGNPKAEPKYQDVLPPCCGLVPVLYKGLFSTWSVKDELDELAADGSHAAPGFMNPEGVVVFHTAANVMFKATLENDGVPKSLVKPV